MLFLPSNQVYFLKQNQDVKESWSPRCEKPWSEFWHKSATIWNCVSPLLLLKQPSDTVLTHIPCHAPHSLGTWHSPSDRNQGTLSCSSARELGQLLSHLQCVPSRSSTSLSPQNSLSGWQPCSSDKQSPRAPLLLRVKSWTWSPILNTSAILLKGDITHNHVALGA